MSNMIDVLAAAAIAASMIVIPSPARGQVNEPDPTEIIVEEITHPVTMTSPDPENPIIDKDDETGEFHFAGTVGRPPFGQRPDRVLIIIDYPHRPGNPDRATITVDNDGNFQSDKNLYGDGNGTISIQPTKNGNSLGKPTEFAVEVR